MDVDFTVDDLFAAQVEDPLPGDGAWSFGPLSFNYVEKIPLASLIIPDDDRDSYLSHKRLLVEYNGVIDKQEYAQWADRVLYRRVVFTLRVEHDLLRDKTYALFCWDDRFSSRDRRVLDYQGVHPVLRKVNRLAHIYQVNRFLDSLR